MGLFILCGMGYGGGIVLGGFFLSDNDGATSLGDEGIGQILDWCGDIGCGGCRERRCLQRKKGYGGCGLPGVQDGLGGAVHRLHQVAGDGGLGAAHLLGGAAGGGEECAYEKRGDVVFHGVFLCSSIM